MLKSIIAAILIAILVLPVIVLLLLSILVFFASNYNNNKPIATLSELACSTCGIIYGVEAAELACQEHLDRCEETRKANPGLLINFVRFWEVRCPNCQATARFYFDRESLDS